MKSTIIFLIVLCIASCGAIQESFKQKAIELEKECMEKLEESIPQVISQISRDISLSKFCWCFVKESPPKTKEDCMAEAASDDGL